MVGCWRTPRVGIVIAALAVVALGGAVGCSSDDERSYDIAPIFPLSEDKCATYNGEEVGEGFTASCMVTKADCERAVNDWNSLMRERGVTDAMEFSCD